MWMELRAGDGCIQLALGRPSEQSQHVPVSGSEAWLPLEATCSLTPPGTGIAPLPVSTPHGLPSAFLDHLPKKPLAPKYLFQDLLQVESKLEWDKLINYCSLNKVGGTHPGWRNPSVPVFPFWSQSRYQPHSSEPDTSLWIFSPPTSPRVLLPEPSAPDNLSRAVSQPSITSASLSFGRSLLFKAVPGCSGRNDRLPP